jgi:MurNAc alpha-1-phosphate uridylyltransferase
MADSLAAPLAGVALAAGAGTRLAPLTLLRPKPMCPVGDRPLLDWALDALAPAVGQVAVNVHHHAAQIVDHLAARADGAGGVHVSHEVERALGTAGAIGNLRGWLAGRGALVVNADTWHRADLAAFAAGWDGERVRVLTPTPLPFGPRSGVVASILPWHVAQRLTPTPSGLWELVWHGELEQGRLDAVHAPGDAVDCATPADYLRANLVWSGGASVIGAGAVVEGSVTRSVVWPGASVARGEVLVDAIRADRRTVLVR